MTSLAQGGPVDRAGGVDAAGHVALLDGAELVDDQGRFAVAELGAVDVGDVGLTGIEAPVCRRVG